MDVCSTLTSITAIIIIITFAMEFIFEKNNYVRRTSEECMWGGWMDGWIRASGCRTQLEEPMRAGMAHHQPGGWMVAVERAFPGKCRVE